MSRLSKFIVYFQLDDRQEKLEARRTTTAENPRMVFMDYIRSEVVDLSPTAWEYFRGEIFTVMTRAREKAALEKAAQVV